MRERPSTPSLSLRRLSVHRPPRVVEPRKGLNRLTTMLIRIEGDKSRDDTNLTHPLLLNRRGPGDRMFRRGCIVRSQRSPRRPRYPSPLSRALPGSKIDTVPESCDRQVASDTGLRDRADRA